MSKKQSKLLPLLGPLCFSSAFMIVGFWMTYVGTTLLYEALTSSSWQTCEGIITSSEIVLTRGGKKAKKRKMESIRYDYIVEGIKYTGDRYKYGYYGDSAFQGKLGIVDAHPVGTVVKVYYLPSSPEKSVLVPGANLNVYLLFGAGVVFFLAGAYIAFGSIRSVLGK